MLNFVFKKSCKITQKIVSEKNYFLFVRGIKKNSYF